MGKNTITQVAKRLLESRNAVALTGAGISTESGIPDFRSSNGLWSRFDPIEYGTIDAFHHDPDKVWGMLQELVTIIDAVPNQGHKILAAFEKRGLLKGIITQNIDGLHQKAGSKAVIELHGSISSFTCLSCYSQYSLQYVKESPVPPRCSGCNAILKPDIIFFGEQIPTLLLQKSYDLLTEADILLVIGTSCQVAPASFFPKTTHTSGGHIIEVNLSPVLDDLADIAITESFSKSMKLLEDELQFLEKSFNFNLDE